MKKKQKSIPHKIEILKALDIDIKEHQAINIPEGYKQTQLKIKKKSRKILILQIWNKTAAIITIVLFISTLALLYALLQKQNSFYSHITYTEITASPGAILKTQLPDDSEVWLNSGATLRFPSQFGSDKRMVELTGEAFFDVKTNPDHPFEVSIPSGLKVVAKGTSFNINAYKDEQVNEVALQHGNVEVLYDNIRIDLRPSEMAYFNKGSHKLRKSLINIEEKIGWKDGLLIFRNTSLDEVLKKLSRRHNAEICLHKERDIDYHIRATFSSETLPQILDVLKLAAPITWSVKEMQQNNDYTFTKQQINVWVK